MFWILGIRGFLNGMVYFSKFGGEGSNKGRNGVLVLILYHICMYDSDIHRYHQSGIRINEKMM